MRELLPHVSASTRRRCGLQALGRSSRSVTWWHILPIAVVYSVKQEIACRRACVSDPERPTASRVLCSPWAWIKLRL